MLIPRDLLSWMKTAWRMRSVDVRSRNVPVGRVRLRTSRNRRSMALVVLTCLRPARVLQRKQASRSSGSLRREATAPGQMPCQWAARILSRMFLILCARHRRTGMPCRTTGKAASRPLPPSTKDHPEALAGEAAVVRPVEEALPFRGALAAGAPEVDDLLPAVVADAERHQNRPPERAVGHHRLAVILRRPTVEGVDRRADRSGTGSVRSGTVCWPRAPQWHSDKESWRSDKKAPALRAAAGSRGGLVPAAFRDVRRRRAGSTCALAVSISSGRCVRVSPAGGSARARS